MVQNVLFVIGGVTIACATGVWALLLGRFLIGIGAAFSVAADIPYLNEIPPAHYRGRLASFYECLVVTGTIAGSLFSIIIIPYSYGWRILSLFPVIVATINILGVLSLPESPFWLVGKGRIEEARKSLSVIYVYDEDLVEYEILHIVNAIVASRRFISVDSHSMFQDVTAYQRQSSVWVDYKMLLVQYRLPMIIVLVLMFFSQFTGSVVIRNYAPIIFEDAGFSFLQGLWLNFCVSVINACFVWLASSFLDTWGRKPLLLLGIAITALGCSLMALGFWLGMGKSIEIYLSSSILTTVGFSVGFGTVGWILSAEMFPSFLRGNSLAISTIFRNIFEFITNFLFLYGLQKVSSGAIFVTFAILGLAAAWFVVSYVIETRDRDPQDILEELQLQRRGKRKSITLSSAGSVNDHENSITASSSSSSANIVLLESTHNHDAFHHPLYNLERRKNDPINLDDSDPIFTIQG